MAGFYGAFLTNFDSENIPGFDLSLIDDSSLKERMTVGNGIVGRNVLNKLQQDRFLKTFEDITICFEGINLSAELNSSAAIFKAYNTTGIDFVSSLEGSFSGFVYDEKLGKIFLFNDHLSTKNIFYFYSKSKGFVFSSELLGLSSFLKKSNISYTRDSDAVYMMALYGFLLEDHTYIREVKKLPFGSILIYDLETKAFEIKKHHTYSAKKKEIKYSEAIERINALTEASVSQIWKKSEKYSSKNLSFLSGGMDARTNVIIAKDIGFDDIRTITFGQSNSKDVKYAQQISSGEKLDGFQRFLDHPDYLTDNIIENYIKPNDGLMMFQTSAHASSTIKSFNLAPYSLIHTGQIGDLLFGSFAKENYNFFKNRASIGYTGFVGETSMLDKIEALPEVLKKYQERGYEVYTYEQRVINATLVGDRSLNNSIDNYSPFFSKDLINLCLSLPNEFKTNQMIYFDWLKKHHPRALSYPWDRINMKPDATWKIVSGLFFKKYVNGAKKYFGLKYDSMNPYNTWLKNESIMAKIDAIFNEEYQKSVLFQEIKEDLKKIYNKNIFEYRNKFAVITALVASRLYFED